MRRCTGGDGDFECPYCGQAEPVVRALLANFGDLRYVWRHLPLTDVLAAPLGVPVPFAYWLRRASVGRSISGATKTA